jgi:hypothetical protein
MSDIKNERIDRIVRLIRELRASVADSRAIERLKMVEKDLLQLDAELDSEEPGRRKG